jgi:signal transduction histidine kinase
MSGTATFPDQPAHKPAIGRSLLPINPRTVLALSIALDAAISLADYLTGYEIRFSLLHLIPVAAATWAAGRRAGLVVAAFAATAWFLSFRENHGYTHVFYFYWKGAVIVVSYVIFVLMLSRLRETLENSDARFTTVLEGFGASVYVEDPANGRVLYANRRYREIFGAGAPPFTQAQAATDLSGEVYFDAPRRWYLVQSRALRWTDGRNALLRVLADVTEEKKARELLNRHRDEVHRSARLVALGEFASAIAHELSQPLAAIATYSNTSIRLLDSGRSDPPALRDAMEKCRVQAKRAGDIIQRLREFLRHQGPALATLDLNDVARAAANMAGPELREAGVSLSLDLAPALPAVRADRILIEQVVLNLVRNAIEALQASAATGADRRITIASGADDGGGAALRVCDSGPGVPAEERDRLFEAFVTTKPGGLGLGLSICRSIVAAHGGAIRHQPNGGRGSIFAFSLPAAKT